VLINPWCERKNNNRILKSFAILRTALALVPGGAHVRELANEITLGRENYVIMQQIYRGWARSSGSS
jgi:hypothetical protein